MSGKHLEHIVPLEPAWFALRQTRGYITASFAGNCLGVNTEDWTTKNISDPIIRGQTQIRNAFVIINDPSKNKFKGNWFTRRGNFHEPDCFKVFEAATTIPVLKSNVWQSGVYSWLFATPDGLIDDETLLEVKNPWGHMHSEIPAHYMTQVQIQLHCANRKRAYFMSQCIKDNCARIWVVDYSPSYHVWMMDQLQHFHDCVMTGRDLDFSKFNFKPPYVKHSVFKTILSLTDLVGEITPFPEPPPWANKRKETPTTTSSDQNEERETKKPRTTQSLRDTLTSNRDQQNKNKRSLRDLLTEDDSDAETKAQKRQKMKRAKALRDQLIDDDDDDDGEQNNETTQTQEKNDKPEDVSAVQTQEKVKTGPTVQVFKGFKNL